MSDGVESFALTLSRSAFSPRDAARAGDIWRLFQDAAVVGSTRRGWDPRRYAEAGVAFVVRRMRVVHHREASFGPPLAVRTWVSTFKRDMFSDRQIRVDLPDGPLASATQEWVHVRTHPEVRADRAPPELRQAFVIVQPEPDVALPTWSEHTAPSWELTFPAWYGWMDPLGHANHPLYVDWCDEALTQRIAARGGKSRPRERPRANSRPRERPRANPFALAPVAEAFEFRSGVVAPEQVTVRSVPVGVTEAGDLVCEHEILGDGALKAVGTTIRRLVGGDLVRLVGG